MPFIEIITDSKSQTQLNKVITKKMVNDCDILFIKDKNIENTKNIKLETLVLNRSVENDELMSKIMKNSKNLILNLDLNENLQYEDSCNVISYGYSSKSDITVSSVEEDELLICVQHTIKSMFDKVIEPQEIKVNDSNCTFKFVCKLKMDFSNNFIFCKTKSSSHFEEPEENPTKSNVLKFKKNIKLLLSK